MGDGGDEEAAYLKPGDVGEGGTQGEECGGREKMRSVVRGGRRTGLGGVRSQPSRERCRAATCCGKSAGCVGVAEHVRRSLYPISCRTPSFGEKRKESSCHEIALEGSAGGGVRTVMKLHDIA